MASATAIPEVLELAATSNPYLDFYDAFCKARRQELFQVFDPSIGEKKRRAMYKALDVSVAMKYAWAIPDERALRIIKHYGPIVEMGAGTGYWARLLQLRGVDIVCYDLHVADEDANGDKDEEDGESQEDDDEEENGGEDEDEEEGEDEDTASEDEDEGQGEENEGGEGSGADSDDEEVEVEQIYWTDVRKGTPKVLRKHADRTLFLCYPDDFEDSSESMALQALHNYSGEYVIHVGEMFGQTLCLPGAWGRTSSSEFQEHLASVYHKILQVPLPSWHSSVDTLTVWKRTKTSIMDNAFYAFIPEDERLDLVAACASTRHLLEESAAPVPKEKAKFAKRKAESGSEKPAASSKPAQPETLVDGASTKKKNKSKNRKRQKTTGKP